MAGFIYYVYMARMLFLSLLEKPVYLKGVPEPHVCISIFKFIGWLDWMRFRQNEPRPSSDLQVTNGMASGSNIQI